MTKSLLLVLTLSFVAACSPKNSDLPQPPESVRRLPIDSSSAETQRALEEAQKKQAEEGRKLGPLALEKQDAASALDPVLAMGKRNLEWLDHINSLLPDGQKLSFSNKSNMTGTPIETPKRYSDKLVLKRFDDMKTQLPKEMSEVIFDGKPFTDQPPIELKAYLDWGNKIDKLYQTGTRWLMMLPYLDSMAQRRIDDIRGYYFLNKEPDLSTKLTSFKTLPAEDHDRLKQWLLLICFNTTADDAACEASLQTAEAGGTVDAYFAKYNPPAKELWNNFFIIQGVRNDIKWTSATPNVLNFPFRDPGTEKIRSYLKVNLEDEWKWNGWNLIVNFNSTAQTHIVFEAGSTPHVNGIAGNIITMDGNGLLTEWDVQWTIRHEFGHVLGFPDCYVEFYEPSSGEMISYQLDVTNLMCSRQGRLQEKHYTELKRVYYKQ